VLQQHVALNAALLAYGEREIRHVALPTTAERLEEQARGRENLR